MLILKILLALVAGGMIGGAVAKAYADESLSKQLLRIMMIGAALVVSNAL